ncbi:HtaA domain-containing protein [Pseudonocardia sp. CA-107938]|uniref:HtaA domain-containing protein n=1 Tax=Pseudonocardia sp. CA-107938 TaxID=3240021 RepID=UPI003D8BAC8C
MNRPPTLEWTIKLSFLRYIASMPDGRCSVTDGADVVMTPDAGHGPFSFALDSADKTDGTWRLHYRGDVRFAGHHGFLFVRIADPAVVIQGGFGQLSVCGEHDGPTRVPLVRFTVPTHDAAATTTWRCTDVRLTAEGAELFGGVYHEDDVFDDLTITLPSVTT